MFKIWSDKIVDKRFQATNIFQKFSGMSFWYNPYDISDLPHTKEFVRALHLPQPYS